MTVQVADAARARINRANTSMSLGGDGIWDIAGIEWIDDIINADGYVANTPNVSGGGGQGGFTGVSSFVFTDSLTYNGHDDSVATTNDVQFLGNSVSGIITLGSSHAGFTTTSRFTDAANLRARAVIIKAAAGEEPVIDIDGTTGSGDPGGRVAGGEPQQITIAINNAVPKMDYIFEGLNFVHSGPHDYGHEPGGARGGLVQIHDSAEANGHLPIFRGCTFDIELAAVAIFQGGGARPHGAGPDIEFNVCAFRHDQVRTGTSAPTSNFRPYTHGHTGSFLFEKITGILEYDHCTFIGLFDTDGAVPALVGNISFHDDGNVPDYSVKNSILFNMKQYQGGGPHITAVENVIEWDSFPTPTAVPGFGNATKVNAQLVDPLFVDVANSYSIDSQSPAVFPGNPSRNIGFDKSTAIPVEIESFILE